MLDLKVLISYLKQEESPGHIGRNNTKAATKSDAKAQNKNGDHVTALLYAIEEKGRENEKKEDDLHTKISEINEIDPGSVMHNSTLFTREVGNSMVATTKPKKKSPAKKAPTSPAKKAPTSHAKKAPTSHAKKAPTSSAKKKKVLHISPGIHKLTYVKKTTEKLQAKVVKC